MSTEGAAEAEEGEEEKEEEEEEEGAAVAVAARAISTRHDGKRLDAELGLVIFAEGPPLTLLLWDYAFQSSQEDLPLPSPLSEPI